MPKTIQNGKVGWKKLQKILDAHKDAINSNAPIQGDGISLSQTASGTIIARRKEGEGKGMEDGQWMTINVMDDQCNQSTIQVWAKPQ